MIGMIPDHLLQAYRRTGYVVLLPQGEVVLRIDENSPPLDALLDAWGYPCWAFITAYNPGSRLDPAGNDARHTHLLREIEARRLPSFPGRGIGCDGRWPVEESLLVLGLDVADARTIGKAFGQLAVVAGERRGPALLVPCGHDPCMPGD